MNTCMPFCGKSGCASAPSNNSLHPTPRAWLSCPGLAFMSKAIRAGRVNQGVGHFQRRSVCAR
jgi:hypothetical protein